MVKLQGETSVEFGGSFQIPTPGDHLMVFQDDPLGIDTDDTADQQERFKCQLEVIDDPDENENGSQIRNSIPLDWSNAEEIICDILTCAGIAAEIEDIINKAHPDNNFTVFDNEVQEQIKLKLPGCVVQCKTSVRKYKNNNGDIKTYGQIDRMEMVEVATLAPVQTARQSQAGRRTGSAKARNSRNT